MGDGFAVVMSCVIIALPNLDGKRKSPNPKGRSTKNIHAEKEELQHPSGLAANDFFILFKKTRNNLAKSDTNTIFVNKDLLKR